MTELSLREAATAVSAQIEQFYDARVTFVWNNTDANKLGFCLPGPHTVGFVCRTYFSDGGEFLTVIPLAKATIKDPANMGAAMDAFGRAWIAALENEQERLRPQQMEPEPMPDKTTAVLECPNCGHQVLRGVAIMQNLTQCPNCHAPLKPPSANREQKPDSGRSQPPRRNEEKRPL